MAAASGKVPVLSKAEYLKRYLAAGEGRGGEGKRKRRRRQQQGAEGRGMRIVDDDAEDWKSESSRKEDVAEDEDEEPVVAEFFDDRPVAVKRMEEFRNSKKWRLIEDLGDNSPGSDCSAPPESATRSGHQSPTHSSPRTCHDSPGTSPKTCHDSPGTSPKTCHDSPDTSPPRKKAESPAPSPPRKARHDSPDPSPPRKKAESPAHDKRKGGRRRQDSDLSPPRRRQDTDLSPPRRGLRGSDSDLSPPRRRNGKERVSADLSPARGGSTRMLSGGRAGLVSAEVLREEQEKGKKRERENRHLEDDSRNAATVFRDKSGKRRDLKSERLEQKQKDAEKAKKEEQYAQWGKGLAQKQQQNQNLEDAAREIEKPLARYIDDTDLDKMLREQERDGDPMAKFLSNKKAKESKEKRARPKYTGPNPPPNRFNILPGYRWDGVDRSNGFEQKRFARLTDKKAVQETAYKWSVEDM